MTSNKWFPVSEEITGSTQNMIWMINENNQMALFKPDMTGNDYLIESTIYRVATFFEIPCSKVIPYILNGINGFLSIIEDASSYHRVNGADLYQDVTLDLSLCKIAFLDALCRNQDRHIGNVDFLLDANKEFVKVAASYDTVMSLSNSSTESSMLGINNKRTWNHKEIFNHLKNYAFMQDTFSKINTKEFKDLCNNLEYGDFIYNRAKCFLKSPCPQSP